MNYEHFEDNDANAPEIDTDRTETHDVLELSLEEMGHVGGGSTVWGT